jgi:hypothetical protein
VTAYANIHHNRCIGSGLCGALRGDAADRHTTCVHHHIFSHVEGLVLLRIRWTCVAALVNAQVYVAPRPSPGNCQQLAFV